MTVINLAQMVLTAVALIWFAIHSATASFSSPYGWLVPNLIFGVTTPISAHFIFKNQTGIVLHDKANADKLNASWQQMRDTKGTIHGPTAIEMSRIQQNPSRRQQ